MALRSGGRGIVTVRFARILQRHVPVILQVWTPNYRKNYSRKVSTCRIVFGLVSLASGLIRSTSGFATTCIAKVSHVLWIFKTWNSSSCVQKREFTGTRYGKSCARKLFSMNFIAFVNVLWANRFSVFVCFSSTYNI